MIDHLRLIRRAIKPKIKHQYIYENLGDKNQFFRDIVSEKYNEEVSKFDISLFEPLMTIWDKSITAAENEVVNFEFESLITQAMDLLKEKYENLPDQSENIPIEADKSFDAEM